LAAHSILLCDTVEVGGASGIGRRVIVTGLAGSGKSTLSLAIASKTGLPVIHLDLHYWKPGWTAPSETEWRHVQRGVLAGDAWIADGNYPETLDLRLDRADTVVLLDLPWWVCSGRAMLRGFHMPGELPPGCDYTRRMRLRDEWQLAVRIWRKDRSQPGRERAIVAQHGTLVAVYELRSRRDITEFLHDLVLSNAPDGDPGPAERTEP
jgi:adenylate kinase family enzyme